ncbi:hypothetical protein N0B31_05205 [Salinirubellus salinus]|uniref:Piwi domain-containing protein n=1 Tax=Salinirubellus salinus TaxID=1364945 RepID=A0A9E7UBZ2_9EURY|nr:hypothetical protein [Salinirubellus salinus]UWM55682.1 hypothetical protein N0B31_05205 [Salinirubellus salinus]
MPEFDVDFLTEPDLVFDGGQSAKDPRAGLLKYGPCPPRDGSEHEIVRIGLIGDSWSISAMRGLLEDMRYGILPNGSDRERWNQPFPGLGPNSELRMSFDQRQMWRGRIEEDDLDALTGVRGESKRVEQAINYVKFQMENICSQTPNPDVVIVSIPETLAELLTEGKKADTIRTTDTDFRSRIKLLGMLNDTPTQLIGPKTLRGEDVQPKREVAWNLAVGLLYKARRGRPWKLTELKSNTCYAGISFYDERGTDPDTRASIAQVFMETGENFVIRGDPVADIASDKNTGRTHLSTEDAERLIETILERYGERREERPDRLVIHKSSNFWEEETAGFISGSEGVRRRDFITIREHHPIRLFSNTQYPPLRGTVALPPGREEYYLYTKGFVPEISAYNDSGTPNPIVVRPHGEVNDTSYREICEEILAFSKLDWNSSDFCKKLPVTVGIADAVSDILAEPMAQELPDGAFPYHYYYYM